MAIASKVTSVSDDQVAALYWLIIQSPKRDKYPLIAQTLVSFADKSPFDPLNKRKDPWEQQTAVQAELTNASPIVTAELDMLVKLLSTGRSTKQAASPGGAQANRTDIRIP